MSKRTVKDNINTYCGYDFEGKVTNVIATLQGWVEEHGPDIELDYDQCQYDDDYEFNLSNRRPENAVERAKRLDQEKTDKERQDKWDRENYEKLKKKFEK